MITPIEIRQHEFKKSLRGYDKEEVQGFLNTLSMEWEKLIEEHKRLKSDLDKTQSNLDSLKQVESVLHKTLLQAEETSKSTMENAKKDAELKLQEAENRSQQIVKKALEERHMMEIQVNELVSRRNDILQQLKSFLQAQSERLATFEDKEMKPMNQNHQRNEVEQDEKPSFFESAMQPGSESQMINTIVEEL